jgi:hypothetical protein
VNASAKLVDYACGRGVPHPAEVDGVRLFDAEHLDRLAALMPTMPQWR